MLQTFFDVDAVQQTFIKLYVEHWLVTFFLQLNIK